MIYKIPNNMQQCFNAISELTDNYCKSVLSDEYAELVKSVLATLCRKRPSPLLSGSIEVWGCGVIYALGQVNFLFDKTQTPHTTYDELCKWFKVAKSTASNKAKVIRDLLKMDYYNHEWKLKSKMETTSFVWMVEYKGFVVDARTLPLDVQIVAYQKGMIPYVPFLKDF
jgi:hypothetical protein